ncbi:MAG: DNA polymerase III subunit chi [Rhodocyclaceae bacterium]|nr:DNA polymerase III subunit chi [Rhodocyclaceae bacterium]
MTRIEFLHGAPDRLTAAAGWLRLAWTQRRRVMVYIPTRKAAEDLDRLLWSQPATGFVPHCRADSAVADETAILLADNLDRLPHDARERFKFYRERGYALEARDISRGLSHG